MAMARGHLSLGGLSPCLVTNRIQTPSLPREQAPRQPTPGLSGTRWSEELFCKPSQAEEPPIPGRSPSSEPPEDVPTCEPEPEVAPTQSTEEPFGKSPLLFLCSYQLFLTFSSTSPARPPTPHSIIMIDNRPVGSPLPQLTILFPPPLQPWFPPSAPKNPNASSPWCKAPLIPTLTLARNLTTYD
ncbi:hypothetical protein O181_035875 [Austropuccinia psidii MF-1]|uniref:Uncharacterized protein n=1 Tax=Austropuccinia psidii MF-1 TaxID=1389203 RepID=A0A9Q3D7S1_9BASI|nr:hypothetical protein [Austropuccinia psidii MF-1]